MIDYSQCNIEKLMVHHVGNKSNGEELRLSSSCMDIGSERLREIFVKMFSTAMSDVNLFRFRKGKSNMVFESAEAIFNAEEFEEQTAKIAGQLFKVSVHPLIKPGTLFIAYLSGLHNGEGSMDAVAIVKSEIKHSFFKTEFTETDFVFNLDEGFLAEKPDKAAIIYNTNADDGFKVSFTDRSGKAGETGYWTEDFLEIEIINDKESLEKLQSFRQIIIGGAAIHFHIDSKTITPVFYHTYGMTETYSHIAFRIINDNNLSYTLIGDTEIKTDENNCCYIKNYLTDNNWMPTNDAVEINEDGTFIFLGRSDISINSGGIKINPEEIENFINKHFNLPPNSLICRGVPDMKLGEKLIVNVLKKYSHISWNFNFIEPHKRPREIVFVAKIPMTETGKIKRK